MKKNILRSSQRLWICLTLVSLVWTAQAEPQPQEEPVKQNPEAEPPSEPPFEGRTRMPMDLEMIRRVPSIPSIPSEWEMHMLDAQGLVKTDAAKDILVGQLVLNESGHPGKPSDYCLEDNKLWAGADYRINGLPIFDLTLSKTTAESIGQYFISGEKKFSIADRLREVGPCPDKYGEPWNKMQWRDDWTAPEGSRMFSPDGTGTEPWTHARLKTLPYFAAEQVNRSSFITISYEKGDAVITIYNLFDKPLEMPLVLHYEGGQGKPQPHYETIPINIPPGETKTFSAPTSRADKGSKKDFVLQSVDLSGTLGRVTVDVSEPVDRP